MKDTLVVMCCPSVDRLLTRRAIGSVKESDLRRADFIVMDNHYDACFHYPGVVGKILRFAAQTGKNLILIEDDTEINDYQWIDRLYEASDNLGADIVGCVHTYENGLPNHEGIYIDDDLSMWLHTDMMTDPADVTGKAIYVPALCGAVMLIKNCASYHVDTAYKKYHHDADICLKAWHSGSSVGCALDLKVIHHLRNYEHRDPSCTDTYNEDSAYFTDKWASYIPKLTDIPQLRRYKKGLCKDAMWDHFFQRATRLKTSNKGLALSMFKRVVAECINERYIAEAYFQLFMLEGGRQHLEDCLTFNPCHSPARQSLQQVYVKPSSSFVNKCDHPIICRRCHLLTQ
ncbi:glycosyl transferase, group 2 family protein [Candidatus Magnetobacterium bavaricum]|uniref:Glycosyl transferase, group 2 family protein n=1 Tax=Candidatus Magnetobacterium bavaricum TaxID=29290 RepID=A0A0F3GQQ0_9BACT|nr:glycosyl transferase, group 2 family protein [Candidatus Magnetobacterium bavaricum]